VPFHLIPAAFPFLARASLISNHSVTTAWSELQSGMDVIAL
jgi:hypothetical protein